METFEYAVVFIHQLSILLDPTSSVSPDQLLDHQSLPPAHLFGRAELIPYAKFDPGWIMGIMMHVNIETYRNHGHKTRPGPVLDVHPNLSRAFSDVNY